MKKRSKVLVLALLLLLISFLFACSNSTHSADPKNESASKNGQEDVTVSIVYAIGDPATKEGIADLIQTFMKKYPHINIQDMSAGGTGLYLDFLRTKDAVGEFPDIVEMRDTVVFAPAGKLAELPAELHDLFASLPEFEGKYYNAPLFGSSPPGIMYNKKIFREVGITEEPKTYAEFMEASEKIKKKGIAPLVVGGADIWHMGFIANKYLIDEVFISNPNWISQRNKGEVSFTDPNMKSTIVKLKDLWDKGYVEKGWLSTPDSQTVSMLVTEKAAMLYSGSWMFTQIFEADPNFELGFFALPDEKGDVNVVGLPTLAGWSLSAEAAKDPKKVEAFNQFIKFFFSKEQYEPLLAKVSGLPTTAEEMSYEAIEPMKNVLELVNDPNVKKSMMINQFYGENQIPPQFRNWFYKLIQEVNSGQISVDEALKQADVEYDAQLKAWLNE